MFPEDINFCKKQKYCTWKVWQKDRQESQCLSQLVLYIIGNNPWKKDTCQHVMLWFSLDDMNLLLSKKKTQTQPLTSVAEEDDDNIFSCSWIFFFSGTNSSLHVWLCDILLNWFGILSTKPHIPLNTYILYACVCIANSFILRKSQIFSRSPFFFAGIMQRK